MRTLFIYYLLINRIDYVLGLVFYVCMYVRRGKWELHSCKGLSEITQIPQMVTENLYNYNVF